jgi:glycerol-3-phosphate dehydrogenase
MKRIVTEVLVIGGGATGAGVLRDVAMRGFDAVLVDRADLGEGTTGRYHGLLHSGGRYVVKDPVSAEECIAENVVLRRIAGECIEDTGGMFVTTPWDDPEYADRFLKGCHATGVPVEEIPVGEALGREPRLNPRISRAFLVPDCAMDAWKTIWACVRSAQVHGARALPYHPVVRILRDGDRIDGAVCRDERSGEELTIDARFTINATGVWAGRLADLAGCPGVTVVPGKGIMIATNHRLVNTVVNRCELPGDGDIIVPIRTVSVIGTTDTEADDPDDLEITRDEVHEMLEAGERLVPGFLASRQLRVWAGARPLFQDAKAGADDTRDISRGLALVDHARRDGVGGFITITGGKATTFRLMAEVAVDAMCEQLGEQRPCRTADEELPGESPDGHYWLGSRLARHERAMHDDQLICECELVPRRALEAAIARQDTDNLDDVRRVLRLGMGPCQGGFCIYRATGILHGERRLDGPGANASLLAFLQERWKGVQPILFGDQLRQARLDDWIFQGLLDVEHLATPGRDADSPRTGGPVEAVRGNREGAPAPTTSSAATMEEPA